MYWQIHIYVILTLGWHDFRAKVIRFFVVVCLILDVFIQISFEKLIGRQRYNRACVYVNDKSLEKLEK